MRRSFPTILVVILLLNVISAAANAQEKSSSALRRGIALGAIDPVGGDVGQFKAGIFANGWLALISPRIPVSPRIGFQYGAMQANSNVRPPNEYLSVQAINLDAIYLIHLGEGRAHPYFFGGYGPQRLRTWTEGTPRGPSGESIRRTRWGPSVGVGVMFDAESWGFYVETRVQQPELMNASRRFFPLSVGVHF